MRGAGGQALSRDEEERAQAEESWRGSRGGLWGLLPSSLSGKRVGTDDPPDHFTLQFWVLGPGCSFTPRRRPGGRGSESVP